MGFGVIPVAAVVVLVQQTDEGAREAAAVEEEDESQLKQSEYEQAAGPAWGAQAHH